MREDDGRPPGVSTVDPQKMRVWILQGRNEAKLKVKNFKILNF